MTIDEAIKDLTLDLKSCPKGTRPTYLASHKLSIEALKFRANVKCWYPTLFPEPLPGETKD